MHDPRSEARLSDDDIHRAVAARLRRIEAHAPALVGDDLVQEGADEEKCPYGDAEPGDDHQRRADTTDRSLRGHLGPLTALGKNLSGYHSDDQRDAKWDDHEVVQITEHGNEVGYQVERTQRVGDDGGRERSGVPRGTWVASHELQRVGVALETPCLSSGPIEHAHAAV